jgi:hypothetical protein
MSVTDELVGLFEDFKGRHKDQISALEARIDDFEAAGKRPGAGMSGVFNAGRDYVDVNGVLTPIVAKGEKVSAFCSKEDPSPFSISDYVKASMGFQPRAAVVSGPALVPVQVSSNIIDMVRAASTIIAAGAGTIMIEGPTNLARITGDPTVFQHTEGAADVNESDVTIDAVTCNPKALVALVPLSAEVVADSANLDLILNTSLANAFAAKLDALCLATILADANIPKSAVAHATATWAGVMLAITAALGLDQSLPTCHIATPADFMTRAGQLASTSGMWLGKPAVLANMLELATTKMTASTAILGNMAAAFAIVARQNLNLEVVRFQKPGSYSHLLVAHARMDGIVLQPNHLFIQKLVP